MFALYVKKFKYEILSRGYCISHIAYKHTLSHTYTHTECRIMLSKCSTRLTQHISMLCVCVCVRVYLFAFICFFFFSTLTSCEIKKLLSFVQHLLAKQIVCACPNCQFQAREMRSSCLHSMPFEFHS